MAIRSRACDDKLEDAGFDLADDALGEFVVTLWIVFFLEACLEGPGEYLVEGGTGRSHECLDDLVARLVALAVNQFDEEFSL